LILPFVLILSKIFVTVVAISAHGDARRDVAAPDSGGGGLKFLAQIK